MYTRNTNSKTKVVTVTLSCNEKGCKAHTTGTNNREAWQASRKLGWMTPNAVTAYCAEHRKAYVVREGKAVLKSTLPARVRKSAVAQTKAEKAAAPKGKANKASKPAAKPSKKIAEPTTSIGQSTGKLARSAKK